MLAVSCGGSSDYQNTLPSSDVFGIVRGNRIARVITHDHSPYSYDACDKNGISNGTLNSTCLNDLRASFCKNHIDMTFMSDHPDEMAKFEMSDLLMSLPGDTLSYSAAGNPYSNALSGCSDGFRPVMLVGFESLLMALGMNQHLDTDASVRGTLYGEQTADIRNRLRDETDALVIIPHTESRDIALIESINPDGIEIYNIHANLDPKIRYQSLDLPPFQHMAAIITYLIDPYKKLNPDFAFLGFFVIAPVYFKLWNQLIYDHFRITGLAGTDSHENTFPQKVADGERFDSHRRLTRFVNNHVLTQSTDPDTVKAAIKGGHSSLVVEGLGSPSGMDFRATVGSTIVNIGDTLNLSGQTALLEVDIPSVRFDTTNKTESPVIRAEIRKVTTGGNDEVVASSTGKSISFSTSTAGAYRTHVYIKPLHLQQYMGALSYRATTEYVWIITNHIFIDP